MCTKQGEMYQKCLKNCETQVGRIPYVPLPLKGLNHLFDFYDSNEVNEHFFYHLSRMKNIVNDFHVKKITALKQTLMSHYFAKS